MRSPDGRRSIQIEYLVDHQEHIPTVAQWRHRQWSHLSPSVSLSERMERLDSNSQKGTIPTTFLALSDGDPVGCASLVTSDLSIRGKLSPWLASVYVMPSYRNAGVGTQLVVRVSQEAQALGVPMLYLYTPDRQSFYARLGWQEREVCAYRGYRMTVMQYDLQPGRDR